MKTNTTNPKSLFLTIAIIVAAIIIFNVFLNSTTNASTVDPIEDLIYRIKNNKDYSRTEINAKFTTLGTINTYLDGYDVRAVNLWSSTGKDRKTNASLDKGTVVCIMGEENGYLLVGTPRSTIFNWGYCMPGFVLTK